MNPFKPGDWVRHIAFKSKHKCISINNGEFDNKVSVTNSPSFDNEFMIDYELWQPKVGEWCWFWNQSDINLSISPHIGQYGNLSYSLEFYDNCEPFIGKLPTNLKDLS